MVPLKRVHGAMKFSVSFKAKLKGNAVIGTSPCPRSKAPVRAPENEERSNTNTLSLIMLANGQRPTEETANPSAAAVVTTPSSSTMIDAAKSVISITKSWFSHARNTYMAHVVATPTHLAAFDHHKKSFFTAEEEKEWKGDILAVGVTEKDMKKGENSKFENPIIEKLDSISGGLLSEASSIKEEFTGKAGQSIVVSVPGLGPKHVSLIGLEKATGSSTSVFCVFGESVASVAKDFHAKTVGVALASSETSQLKLSTASAIAKGILLDNYEVERVNSESKKLSLKCVEFFGLGSGPELEKKLKHTEDVCSGVILAKGLVNTPADVLTPELLAEEAEKIAAAFDDVYTLIILDTEKCRELKMGSYLGVAASSSTNPPKFIHLCYKPPSGSVKTKLALVGEGLAFHSGACNIKTGPGSIELMKFGMGGSAAVLGAAKALGQIKPYGVEIHFIVAAGENKITETGMRPGFVLTASNGKTIEVNNTDSEGELALADALVYACNQGVDKIVDLAASNGACVAALGPLIAGIFTPKDELSNEVVAASEIAGERLWRLPMEETINTGGPLFLKQFVDEKVQWLHVDMTGPVWNTKKEAATGFATHSLVEWVLSNSSS